MELLSAYEKLHRDEPERPSRAAVRAAQTQTPPETAEGQKKPVRSDNSSGCTRVHRKRGKWEAKITYQKVTYYLGNFESFDCAAAARKDAEKLLNEDPRQFLAKFA